MIIAAVIAIPDTTKVKPARASNPRGLLRSTAGLTQTTVVAHSVRATHSRAWRLACLRLLAFKKYGWVTPSASMTTITKKRADLGLTHR